MRTMETDANIAKTMYDLPAAAIDKATASIIDDQSSKPRNPKKVHFPKKLKPIAPDYKQKKDAYFLHLINVVKYEKFANDAQALNSHFIKRSSMETLWYKTLKSHYANCREDALAPLGRKKTLAQANRQTGGYEGFDANRYWELQNLMNGMEGMSVVKEVDLKPSHFRAMETARRKRKAEVRLAAAKADQSKDAAQDTTMEL